MSAAAKPQQHTFPELLFANTPKKLFTIDFVPKTGGNSANMEFGYINYTKANGPLSTAPVNPAYGAWIVDDISFIVGDQGEPFLSTNGKDPFTHAMVFDTGGSIQVDVHPIIAAGYYESLKGWVAQSNPGGGITYQFPCNTTLPDFSMNIGNGTATLRAALLNYKNPPPTTGSKSVLATLLGSPHTVAFASRLMLVGFQCAMVLWGHRCRLRTAMWGIWEPRSSRTILSCLIWGRCRYRLRLQMARSSSTTT